MYRRRAGNCDGRGEPAEIAFSIQLQPAHTWPGSHDLVSVEEVQGLNAECLGEEMTIKKVGVLGCGLMGSGIAQVAATAGYDVTVLEQEQKFLDKGFAGIEKSLAKFAEKGTIKGGLTADQKKEAQARFK